MVEECGVDHFVFLELVVLVVVGRFQGGLAEEADMAIEGGCEQGVLVAESVDGPNFLFVHLARVLQLEVFVEEGHTPIFVGNHDPVNLY